MALDLLLSWKVIVTLPENGPDYQSGHKLFNVRSGKSFLKRIGGVPALDFEPKILEPTNVFYNAIRKTKEAYGFEGKKFPYRISSASETPAERIKLNIHLYGPNIVIVTIDLSPISIDPGKADFFKIQNIKTYEDVYKMAACVAGLILAGNHKEFGDISAPKVYPCLLIRGADEDKQMPSDALAVAYLTRHPNVSEKIVNSVISKNQEHQLDGSSLLLDRQGVLARIPYHKNDDTSSARKYVSSCCMLEFAIAISRLFTTESYASLTISQKEAVSNLIKKPELVFINSVTARKTWALLAREFSLFSLIENYINNLKPVNAASKNLEAEPKWSDRKKFLMGILATLFLGVSAWVGGIIKEKLDIFGPRNIALSYPNDGGLIYGNKDGLGFIWETVGNASRYILVIEFQNPVDGKWQPRIEGNRFVTSESTYTLELAHGYQYRWRIIAVNSEDEDIAASKWRYFTVKPGKPPDK